MKCFQKTILALAVAVFLAGCDDGVTDQDKAKSEADDYAPNVEHEYMYKGIGRIKYYPFLECGHSEANVAKGAIENIEQSYDAKCIVYDFNNDGLSDFIAKIIGPSLCENNLCPTFLFVKKNDSSYEKYNGPSVKGGSLAVTTSRAGELYDVVFQTMSPGRCVWKWEQGDKQDYMCVMGTSRKVTSHPVP